MKRTFTKAEVIKFLGCNENTRPCRIIEALENFGFKNVEKVGRGNKTTYICEQSDDTDEQCYYLFKDILINEFGYAKKFDYNLCLDIINFHINKCNGPCGGHVSKEEYGKMINSVIDIFL